MSKMGSFLTGRSEFYQTAYVTTDLDRSLSIMGDVYGMKEFMVARHVEFPAAPGRTSKIHLALGWRGNTQYELIQPVEGAIDAYRAKLPRGNEFAMNFHHFCQAFETQAELDEVHTRLKAAGIPLPIQSGTADNAESSGLSSFFYADFTATLGHFLEFICFTEEGEAFMKSVPHN